MVDESNEENCAEFSIPHLAQRAAEAGLHSLDPWWEMETDVQAARHKGIAERYPDRKLIPFSRRQDNDDVACWDLSLGGVTVVHDFAESGSELIAHFSCYEDWLRQVLEDFIHFDE
ncbi:hypothetical protein AB0P36_34705 [Streptomyces flavidovirens]|uniref:hypothetical protein n=1 Tax=Streptomyces flavidovirens TaxID=67298 RepID=UPI00342E797A